MMLGLFGFSDAFTLKSKYLPHPTNNQCVSTRIGAPFMISIYSNRLGAGYSQKGFVEAGKA